MLGNPGYVEVTDWEWLRVKNRYRGCCAYCGKRTPRPHMDHVVPLARGGRHAPANVVPACAACNVSKFKFFLVEWRLRQRRTTVEVAELGV
ncbi:HNH endonuclease [Blastococcus deserti]|uniref:HNH endonuclease n=1 Tax=Blastococcus deserti TaxID=2259033 RepID=A0ABW4XEQ2_9ACTN